VEFSYPITIIQMKNWCSLYIKAGFFVLISHSCIRGALLIFCLQVGQAVGLQSKQMHPILKDLLTPRFFQYANLFSIKNPRLVSQSAYYFLSLGRMRGAWVSGTCFWASYETMNWLTIALTQSILSVLSWNTRLSLLASLLAQDPAILDIQIWSLFPSFIFCLSATVCSAYCIQI
jgi:hypothetical protein